MGQKNLVLREPAWERTKKFSRAGALFVGIFLLLSLLLWSFAGCSPKAGDGALSSDAENSGGGNDAAVSSPSPSPDDQPPAPEPGQLTFRKTGDGGSLGVWWWNNRHAKDEKEREQYLSFLEKNGVSEIYLWVGKMTDEQIAVFLRDARGRGMEVAWLSGDASWILPEVTGGDSFLQEEYLAYQSRVPAELRFSGLHLDVEPHQLEDFSAKKEEYWQDYADYVRKTAAALKAAGDAGGALTLDVPFWLDGVTVEQTSETGESEKVELLELLATTADGLAVMSYRDSAAGVLSLCTRELELAAETGCRLLLCVDCYSEEGDDVSFREEGKAEMAKELETLYAALRERRRGKEPLPSGCGIAIHYLNSWYDLQVGRARR